jgi:hypothetical protein
MKLLTPHDGPKTPQDRAASQYSDQNPSTGPAPSQRRGDIGNKVNTHDGSKHLIPKTLPDSDFPHKPHPGESVDHWFNYYHQCRLKGYQYSLRDLAQDTGLKLGYIKLLHRQYRIEHHIE